jgi:hypothetical protein
LAREGLKTPQEQKCVMYAAASSRVPRRSFTQSTIVFANEALTMRCPAHGGNLQHVFVRQMGGSAFEPSELPTL